MKRFLLAVLLACLLVSIAQAQDGKVYLPVITKSGDEVPPPQPIPNRCELMTDPILRVTDGDKVIDLLGPGSGWELSDPYWNPQIAQFKGGGEYSDSGMAEGSMLVHKEYSNVVETIPLSVTGYDQGRAIQTIRDLLQLGRQASDYWTESYEYDDVWLEAKPGCDNSLTGYSRIIKMSIPELKNPFGQPFYSSYAQPVMEDISLIIEREPFWRGTPPGEIIGPLYNLIKNPDFELWNFGTGDSQPDSWTDLETLWITGGNSRDTTPKWGNYAIEVRVSGSTKSGASKGITQVLSNIKDKTEYTIVAWVRNSGVSNGVGRILITYSSQLELYRSNTAHGWTLYTGKITTGLNDVVAVNCEILTTAANTDGTVYFDSLLFLEGDWIEEAKNNTLPYLSGSHIVNHWDKSPGIIKAGDINFVDVWNIPGDVDALTRLIVINDTTPVDINNPIENIKNIRIGMRRSKDIFLFDNIYDSPGINDTTGASDNSYTLNNVGTAWISAATKIITSASNTLNNEGRFRLLARLYDDKGSGSPTLRARVNYFLGSQNISDKYLDSVNLETRQNWSIIDLTPNATINFDRKFNSSPPSQFGYEVELSRSSGTGNAKIDYVMAMPTDGGFLEANINPPLAQGTGLIVDNTNSTSISGYQPFDMKWTKFYEDTTITIFGAAVQYNDYLYIWSYKPGASYILKTKIGGIPEKKTGITNLSYNMIVYNGDLYYSVAGGDVYKTNGGNSYPGTKVIEAGWLHGLAVYNGKLYAPGTYALLDGFNIKSWDDTSSSTFYDLPGGLIADIINVICVYNNKLYVASSAITVRYYDYATDTWTITPNIVLEMIEFKGGLYGKTGSDIRILNGDNWDLVFTPKAVPYQLSKFIIYNDYLYFDDTQHNVYRTMDGFTWEELPNLKGIQLLATYNNFLIGGFYSTALYYTVDSGAEYQITDYKGGVFTSPPEKRHRWFFNWDRDNYINNIDDKALIGLGYVPRYLSLINYP